MRVSAQPCADDQIPPTLNCPTNGIVVTGQPGSGTNVIFTVTATDNCDTNVTVSCVPSSGSLFPCGVSTVDCTAMDSHGNLASCTFTVTAKCDCIALKQEAVIANPAGVPGQFNYTFTLVNTTNVPIGYLFIVPVTNCLTVSPDIIKFSPPVMPGATTNIFVVLTVSAACPSNYCFTFAAHTTNLTECCSITHCIKASSTGQPKLDISLETTNAVVSWSDVFSNHVLECTLSLSPPIDWSPAPGTRVFANGRILVTIPIGPAAARFYRLRLP